MSKQQEKSPQNAPNESAKAPRLITEQEKQEYRDYVAKRVAQMAEADKGKDPLSILD